jgi:short-subunit dehydrogenase
LPSPLEAWAVIGHDSTAMVDLAGKRVWLTGASSGIGKALALALAAEGAKLVLSARRESLLEDVRSACARSDDHMVCALDLANPEDIEAAVGRVREEFGRIDVLINGGGISQRSVATDTDLDVNRRIMDVNFHGAVALTKAVLPDMIGAGHGNIVVISSLMAKLATPMRSAYAASKHALHGYFDCLRAEVHDQGVRVTIICPGYVNTDITRNALTADGSRHAVTENRQARAMTPEEFAPLAIRAIERERSEVFIGGKEVWAARLRPFFPWLYERLVRKVQTTG